MNVLVIGSGGREHSLCWAIKKSPKCDNLYCLPGNMGIASVAECLPLDVMNNDQILKKCQELLIDFVLVGPEVPLVNGIIDHLSKEGILCFGPRQEAAMIEGSKIFMKDILTRSGVPTAEYECFDEYEAAVGYIMKKGAPIVIKAEGLAAGKGVTVAYSIEEALNALDNIMKKKIFGDAGSRVVIEECLVGQEVGFSTICHGLDGISFAPAQGHKAAFDNDKGPNTGGMGAYSPVPIFTPEIEKYVMDEIIAPVLKTMCDLGKPFSGILYAGLMITKNGPKVLEFNARFGDPEIQAILPRLKTDFLEILTAAAEGRLKDIQLEWHDGIGICVVMASNGYPGDYKKGTEIKGLDSFEKEENALLFHAGTKLSGNGIIISNGGRVLGVSAIGKNVKEAQKRAYSAIDRIDWPDGFYRRDIGWRAAS